MSDDELKLNTDNEPNFSDIIISADDTIESILEKFASVSSKTEVPVTVTENKTQAVSEIPENTELKNETVDYAVAEAAEDAAETIEETSDINEALTENNPYEDVHTEEENISEPAVKRIKQNGRVNRFFKRIRRMAREEGLDNPRDFLLKLFFTLYELLGRFFKWFGRISRYLILPASIGLVAVVIVFFTGYTVAIKVSMNDDTIGYVNSAPEYDEARISAEKKLAADWGEGYQIDMIPRYSLSLVPKSEVIEGEDLIEAISSYSEEVVNKNYGLYVDGVLIGTYRKESMLNDLLESIKAPYKTGEANESAVFMQDVEIVEGMYDGADELTINEIRDRLMKNTSLIQYEFLEDDSIGVVLARFGITRENFELLNPGIDVEKIMPGDKVNITETKPLVSVQVVRTVNYTEPIPYETETNYDSGVWENTKTVVTAGVDGLTSIVANVTYVDGVEVTRDIISEVVSREPVTEIIIQGTKTIAPSGNFIWPLKNSGYVITEHYAEWRSDHIHGALDIAWSQGTPIYAADSGVVIEAGWDDSYGYYVLINHQDSINTRYAHLSAIETEVGALVYQGQEIGLMGTTGYSTGPHLHFEVLINGQRQDPELYVTPP